MKKLCDCRICKLCKHREAIKRWNGNNPEALKAIRDRTDKKRRARPDWVDKKHDEYLLHRDSYLARASKRQQENREANYKYVCEYLSEHGCVDCDETDIVVLDFDHVRGKKLDSINRLMNRKPAIVIAEILKCVVRCSNCHRRRHAKEKGFFRFTYTPHAA